MSPLDGFLMSLDKNHWTEMLWRLMQKCPYWISGLRRAGFTGGWLGPFPNTQWAELL